MTNLKHDAPSISQRTDDPKRLADLIATLEAEKQDLEQTRQALRQKMADVEWELGQLTRQQADLQKIHVALDRLRAYLGNELDP